MIAFVTTIVVKLYRYHYQPFYTTRRVVTAIAAHIALLLMKAIKKMNGSVIYLLLLFFYTLSSKIMYAYQILFDDDRVVGRCYAACIQEESRKLNDLLVKISLDLYVSFCILCYAYSVSEEPATVDAIIIIFLTPHPLCFMHPVVCKS